MAQLWLKSRMAQPSEYQSFPVSSATHDLGSAMSQRVKPQVARLYKNFKCIATIFFQLLFSIFSSSPDYEPRSYIEYYINMFFFYLLTDLLISYVINHS